MYAAPPEIETVIHARLPERLWATDRPSRWLDERGGGPLHSFLEGPSFDRAGRLWFTDLAHGRLLRLDGSGEVTVAFELAGLEPNGLKVHHDGRIFVACRHFGIVVVDPQRGSHELLLRGPTPETAFHGLNDLHFSLAGDLYFTDQGNSALEAPFGRVWRLTSTGRLDLLMEGLAGPNGLVLNPAETILYVAETRTNRILSLPLHGPDKAMRKAGVFVQLSGSPVGPDGLAMDTAGNLSTVHAGFGTVWQFSPLGEPIARIRSCAGLRTTNLAYGATDPTALYITEAAHGVILKAKMKVAGQPMFGLI